jgi:hypothetical protein
MIGNGISLLDLMELWNSIKTKDLVLQVKITDGEWEDISKAVISKMITAVTSGKITQTDDIRLRLFAEK